jgi:hypothetical protein
MQRRLAAILAADVVGYSRLMGADEMGTITALKSHRRQLIDSGIAEHHGRIVKTTGDGMLVEFASVVDAVGCAVKIQRSMVGRNAGIAAEKQIVFRIGINVGDIIIDGDDIFGDGVNIAAGWKRFANPAASVFQGGKRPDQGQAFNVFRRSGRAGREEHRAGGGCVRVDRQGYRGNSRNGHFRIRGRCRSDARQV